MIDLKKIINKPVNLSGPKGLNKNPLMDKFRDNKIKRVNFKYKEEKEEDVVIVPANSERPVRVRKPSEKIIRDKEPKVTDVVLKKKERKSLRHDVVADDSKQVRRRTKTTTPEKQEVTPIGGVSVDVLSKKKGKLQKVEQPPKPVVKEIKELPPEVVQAKEDLTYLKKKFAKLLLPVKWSREVMTTNLEE